MKRFMDKKAYIITSMILVIILFAGCGGGGGTGHWLAGNQDVTAPTVTSVVPLNNATSVAINAKVSATFSEAMDPATITTTTFTLKQGTTTVAGSVAYYGVTAVFTPAANLSSNTLYTATVTTGAKDIVGNAMTANKVWTFTTGAAADATAPTVTLTVPANAATGVLTNAKTIATFSEAMDPATITTTTFTLKQGATAVAGSVTYSGVTAVFTPTSNLTASALYTATITTGAKDLAGNALAVNKVWTFTTGAAADTTRPTVTSVIPINAATGVALNTSVSAIFSETMDPVTITTTTFTLMKGTTVVSGTVTYSGVTAIFTPDSNLAASSLYTATITTGAMDLAGNALAAAKVWTFTTGAAADTTRPAVTSVFPNNNATGVALNTSLSAIFNEAMDPVTIDTTTFTLMRGATAVSGTVTYSGVTAVFTPDSNLAASTTYTATITTGARDLAKERELKRNQLGGNQGIPPAASSYVWTFTTGAAADTTRPTVTSVVPLNNATAVALNTSVTAVFSEAMNPAVTSTFTLKQGTTVISGSVNYSGVTAVFTPDSNLTANSVYTATISTAAMDLSGNTLAVAKTWTFTTGAAADTTRPTVTSVVPANNATGVALNTSVTAIFSEAMDPAVTSTFTLKKGTTLVLGSVNYSGVTAVFTPDSNLTANTVYTATISTAAMDLSGNTLAVAKTWTFTTGAAPDTTRPTVTSVVPANSGAGVALNTSVTAIFSEAMDPAVTSTFTLKQGTTVISGSVNYSGVTAIFTPDSALTASKVYTATISTAAMDLAGNTLAAAKVWTFTTGAAPDTTRPTVISVVPLDSATAVAVNTSVTAVFSEAMNPSVTSTFTLKQGTTVISGSVNYSGVTAIFTPDSNLTASKVYTATISTAAMDLAGNTLAAAKVWSFTTEATPDATRPTVTSVVPVNNGLDVIVGNNITATFSEAMDPATLQDPATTFSLRKLGDMTDVSGSVSYAGFDAVFNPDFDLADGATYTATITTAATDLTGNGLLVNKVWSFKTDAIPTVTLTVPANNGLDAPFQDNITATFSEAMDPATLQDPATTFTLRKLGDIADATGSVSYAGFDAVFNPNNDLADGATYTATITTAATDLTGNGLSVNKVWSFKTDARPTVTITVPANNGLDVPFQDNITATFSEAMDPATLQDPAMTFTLRKLGEMVDATGSVSYAGFDAVFNPNNDLADGATYTATITTMATDLAGNALLVNKVWSFKTDARPTVTLTVPADNGLDVSIHNDITATFSEAMDPSTLQDPATTFTLRKLGDMVDATGSVSYTGFDAVFAPNNDLAEGATYTATITTAATDLAGNALLVNKVWSFKTHVHLGPMVVNLGLTEPYGVMSGIGVTLGGGPLSVTGFRVDGDVAIFPAGACVGCDSTTVTGLIENGTDPASDAMTALTAAYNDAIGRSTNLCTLIAAGILITNPPAACGGAADGIYAPGLYWTATSMAIPPGGTITLDAQNDPDAVFVFQSESTINSIGGNTHVILLNQAQAKNVFWVAKSSSTIGGANSDFAGTIIALVAVTVNTGTAMEGRALARTAAVTVQDGALITVPLP